MVDREGEPREEAEPVDSDAPTVDRPTELDLGAVAAAAVEASDQVVMRSDELVLSDRPTDVDLSTAAAAAAALAAASHLVTLTGETVVSGPPADSGGIAIPRRLTSGFAPTAMHAEVTANTASHPLPRSEAPGALPESALPEGTLLGGRYHITRLVGAGGMGAVYAAHDDDLDEDVALKVLRSELSRDGDFKRRLKAEVRLARRVSHPNVCRVHDFGIDDDLVFVTMELVRGHTLRERLIEIRAGRAQPLELAQIVDVILQIGSALSAAHRAGVIHRDVKPDNVILAQGRAVLTDFGVASTTFDGGPKVLVGTPAYLAPEILRGEAFDHRVDVYAVSCMAYELIAGEPPFAARTLALAFELANKRPPYPGLPETFATPALRAVLDRVLGRGLASDPTLRSPTIDRFTDSFAHAARSAPLSPAVRGRYSSEEMTPLDSITPIPVTRRNELRVMTTLAWYGDRNSPHTEEAERIVVDARGVPVRVAAGEIIALFGATRSTGDDADRAAHAALALVGKLGGHAGLDTTRILLRPGDTSLAGPDASSAATLAHDAPLGEVWASAATARQVAARFEVAATSGDACRVTAASRPTRRRRRGSPQQLRGNRARTAPEEINLESLRGEELAAIEAHLERAFQERSPVFVEVRGAAGSGKTRLRKALVASVIARRDVEWLIAVMSPIGEPAPLSIVLSSSSEWYEATTRAAGRDAAARRWLEARATHRPIVLLVEDMQWADATSHALLEHLRATLHAVPVAVVTFVRGDGASAVPPGVHEVVLGPLDDDQAARLARAIAPAAPPEAIAQIIRRAANNPFFVEELARELAAGASGTSLPPTSLPPTIEAILQTHLDQLPDLAHQIAIAAAVIGHGFWRRAVARLVPGLGESALDAALAELERAGMIAAAPPTIVDDDYYQFSSTLLRDVAYSRTPPRERRQYHAAIAGWLDEHGRADQDAAHLLAVAHHREHAGDAARAGTAYRKAGKHCLAMFAYVEAATALRKAATLITVPDPILDEDLADALVHTEGHAAAEPVYQRALDETDDDDGPARARLLYKLGAAASKRGNTSSAVARFRAGLAIAAPGEQLAEWAARDPRTPALLWAGLGWTLGYLLGQPERGRPYCERAVAVLEPTPHRRDLAQALSRLGGTYMRACRFADQLGCNQRNLALAIELHDLDMQLTANVNLGVVHGVLGDLDEAVAATLAARKLAARTGAAASDGLAASNLAGLYLELGRLDEADALLDEAIATNERTGNRYVLCESLVFRARIAAARGNLVTARAHAERSLALARSLANQLDIAIALRILAQLDSRSGNHDGARKRVDEALALAAVHDAFEATRTRAARARILAIAGDPSATGELAELRGELERLGTKRELAVLDDLAAVR